MLNKIASTSRTETSPPESNLAPSGYSEGSTWLELSSPSRDLLLLSILLGDSRPENVFSNFRASSQILSGWLKAVLFNMATAQQRGRDRRNAAQHGGLHEPARVLYEPGFVVVWFIGCQSFINQQKTSSLANLEKTTCNEFSLARNDPGWRDQRG